MKCHPIRDIDVPYVGDMHVLWKSCNAFRDKRNGAPKERRKDIYIKKEAPFRLWKTLSFYENSYTVQIDQLNVYLAFFVIRASRFLPYAPTRCDHGRGYRRHQNQG